MKEVPLSDYSSLKTLVSSKGLLPQFLDAGDHYHLFAIEDTISWQCDLNKEGSAFDTTASASGFPFTISSIIDSTNLAVYSTIGLTAGDTISQTNESGTFTTTITTVTDSTHLVVEDTTGFSSASADQIDFETNYKQTCNQPLEYRSVDGLPKFASAMFVDNLGYWVDGSNGIATIPPGQTGYLTTTFNTDFQLNGIDVHWSGANLGDYINFDVGVYTNNDTSTQNNYVMLAQFGNQYRILGDGTKTFSVDTVKTVPPTFTIPPTFDKLTVYIRTTYVNVGQNSVNLCVNILGYK
jgi:hypothetical protein